LCYRYSHMRDEWVVQWLVWWWGDYRVVYTQRNVPMPKLVKRYLWGYLVVGAAHLYHPDVAA